MSSGWESYYVVVLTGGLAVILPLLVGMLSRLARPRGPQPLRPKQPLHLSLKQLNTRYYMAVNASVALLALALTLIPAVAYLHDLAHRSSEGGKIRGMVAIFSVTGFLILGVVYGTRKKDLSWLTTYRNSETKREESS